MIIVHLVRASGAAAGGAAGGRGSARRAVRGEHGDADRERPRARARLQCAGLREWSGRSGEPARRHVA